MGNQDRFSPKHRFDMEKHFEEYKMIGSYVLVGYGFLKVKKISYAQIDGATNIIKLTERYGNLYSKTCSTNI